MKIIKIALVSLAYLGLVGCASIAGDNTRTVHVSSIPSGASIMVDNQRYGTTPAAVTLPTYIYGGKTVTLKKPGYKEQTLVVNTKFQPVSLWNLLFTPGFIVDAATGDIVKIDPATRNLHTQLARA